MNLFEPPVSRLYVAIAGGTILGGLLISHYFLNLVIHRPEVIASLRERVIFVGWNKEAERLAEAFGTDGTS